MTLKGKNALVTGGGRGIGKAIAKALAAEGAFVAIGYNGSKEGAEQTAAEIQADGGEAEIYQCNVADSTACEAWTQEFLKERGTIDILINNSGITKDNLLMKMKEEEFTQVLDVNLTGTFHMIKQVSRQMLKQRSGRIINLTSVVGICGNMGQANYAASKAGVIGLTKSAAKELASRGITVNAVAPGFIESDMTDAMTDAAKEAVLNQIPLKKYGNAADVANMVCYLASEKAAYITGQVIQVDGGMAI